MIRVFDLSVCDGCRDMSKDGDHELIAKTEAKTTFLLKEHHFEVGTNLTAYSFDFLGISQNVVPLLRYLHTRTYRM
jgi:hypothetical protein